MTSTEHLNGSAKLISDEKSGTEDKKSVKSKLVSGIRGIFKGNTKYISWSEFVKTYLKSGVVDRLEVGHDGWARVVLRFWLQRILDEY